MPLEKIHISHATVKDAIKSKKPIVDKSLSVKATKMIGGIEISAVKDFEKGTQTIGGKYDFNTNWFEVKVNATTSKGDTTASQDKTSIGASAKIKTPDGVRISYSNDFWTYAYTSPASTMITFGSVIDSIPNSAAVRVIPDEKGNLWIWGVDGGASLEVNAKVDDVSKIDINKLKEANELLDLGSSAEVKVGGEVIYIDKIKGWSASIRVGAEASADVDLKKIVGQVSDMAAKGKLSADPFEFDGKAGITVTYFAPPKYSIDANKDLIVRQVIGSAEYNYTLKPSLSADFEKTDTGMTVTVQAGHHEGTIAYDNKVLDNPMTYVCGTQQARELDVIKQTIMPKVLMPEPFDAAKLQAPVKLSGVND